ncbi:MAG: TRAM domain-containing protein [Clostridia bacterium]|nr:TRAM domain-containing protein [Clostridia bacterium]
MKEGIKSVGTIHFPPLTKEKAGLLGLFTGAALAALLIQPIRLLPGSPAACVFAAGLYAALMLSGFRMGKKLWAGENAVSREINATCPKILDTSVIIDGRVLEISRTGFLEGDLIVPSFVLDELRHIADSADDLRRARGRRGLDILRKMQEELGSALRVEDVRQDAADSAEVDVRLLRLAAALGGAVMTNDYNLNKVAGVAGVPVLNINELAGALRPAVLPGEEMTVRIVREGKEPGQGVAYLDDGTMVVVENGRRHVGETLGAEVTTVLQTSAGRMIFGRVKMNENRAG